MDRKTVLAYSSVLILAYIPQIVANIDPVKSLLSQSSQIEILNISILNFSIILLIACIIFTLYSFSVMYKNGNNEMKYVVTFFLALGIDCYLITVCLLFGDGSIIIKFIPQMIPIILSSIIGIVGTFILSCFLIPNYDLNKRYQKQQFFYDSINR